METPDIANRRLLVVAALPVIVDALLDESQVDDNVPRPPRRHRRKNEAFFKEIRDNDVYSRKMTRFFKHELVIMVVEINDLHGDDCSAAHPESPPDARHRFNLFERLVICLCMLAHSLHLEVCKHLFGCSVSLSHSIYNEGIGLIISKMNASSLPYSVTPLLSTELAQLTYGSEFLDHCVYIVDGIYIQVARTASRHSPYYSFYKGFHAWLIVVLIDRQGRIRAIRCVVPRGNSEAAVLRDMYQTMPPILPHQRILGDGAYRHEVTICETPYDRNGLRGTDDPVIAREFNRLLSSRRVLIENVFARVRQDWQVLDGFFQYHRSKVQDTFLAASILTNRLRIWRQRWTQQTTEEIEEVIDLLHGEYSLDIEDEPLDSDVQRGEEEVQSEEESAETEREWIEDDQE